MSLRIDAVSDWLETNNSIIAADVPVVSDDLVYVVRSRMRTFEVGDVPWIGLEGSIIVFSEPFGITREVQVIVVALFEQERCFVLPADLIPNESVSRLEIPARDAPKDINITPCQRFECFKAKVNLEVVASGGVFLSIIGDSKLAIYVLASLVKCKGSRFILFQINVPECCTFFDALNA